MIPEEYKEQISILRKNGYKPIAVASLLMEDTFVFETPEEAIKAHREFEENPVPSVLVGWWYGREEFLEAVKEYEKDWKVKVTINWL